MENYKNKRTNTNRKKNNNTKYGETNKRTYSHDNETNKKTYSHDNGKNKKTYSHDNETKKKTYSRDDRTTNSKYSHDNKPSKSRYSRDDKSFKSKYSHDDKSTNNKYSHDDKTSKSNHSNYRSKFSHDRNNRDYNHNHDHQEKRAFDDDMYNENKHEAENGVCKIYEKCGGCSYITTEYPEQLKQKCLDVKRLLRKSLGLSEVAHIKVYPTIGMKSPLNYRNKGKYAFRNGRMGFYEEGTHRVIYDKCAIQNEKINEIADYIYELVKKYHISIYDEDTGKGFLRHIIIRYGTNTDEAMIIFVTTKGKMFKKHELVKDISSKFPNVKSIIQNINDRDTNAILGGQNFLVYGEEHITDTIKIDDKILKFEISPLSFYQVNTNQMQVLYSKAIEFAKLDGQQVVYDLYSGIGTISICLASKAKQVYGIEIVKDAVKDAIENAKNNNIENARFMSGKVEELLPKLCAKNKADVVFVDPPRSGLENKTIETLLKVKPAKIVYISCNPETLAENIKSFKFLYNIEKVQPVDMFPYTKHVETICLLTLKTL